LIYQIRVFVEFVAKKSSQKTIAKELFK
jgi:hypothetical protein